ncbi:MAG: sugar kinase [Bacteroidota bacterium]
MTKIVTLGEIMLRLSAPGNSRLTQTQTFHVAYGGSEANVAISLSLFGMTSEHVTAFPDNDFGVAATQHLRKFGVITDHIQYMVNDRMGVYFLEEGAMQRASRIVYDRFDSAFAHIKSGSVKWEKVFKDASWFHWSGITPAISQGAADVCLQAIQAANKMGVTVSGDVNYRRNLWQYGKKVDEIMPALIKGTNIVVGGSGDIENCTGIKGDSFKDSCEKLMKKNKLVKKVFNTNRESISASRNKISGKVFDGNEVFKSKEYDLTHIVDRVGTGDAFMAGIIYGMQNKMSDQEALEFGVAAGVLKHSVEEDVNLATVKEVEALVKDENVGKLMR